MKFTKITSINDPLFKEAWKLYEASFPPDQKRTLEQQHMIMSTTNHAFYAVTEKSFIGFVETWDLQEFVFIHYIAIPKIHQGKGIGTAILKEFVKEKKAILEVEPPLNEIKKKRITFYEKQGFHLNNYEYEQPAYSKDKNTVSLLLMSYPKTLTKEEFLQVKKTIYREVYGILIP